MLRWIKEFLIIVWLIMTITFGLDSNNVKFTHPDYIELQRMNKKRKLNHTRGPWGKRYF